MAAKAGSMPDSCLFLLMFACSAGLWLNIPDYDAPTQVG